MSLHNNRFANYTTGLEKLRLSPQCKRLRILSDIMQNSCNMYQKDLQAHYGCVNAIEFSPNGNFLASGGDDRRLLLWNMQSVLDEKPSPKVMKGEHFSNIFCIAFPKHNNSVISAGNDEQILIHDTETGAARDIYLYTNAFYGISVDPRNDCVFATASDDGKILIWDIREPPTTMPFCLAKQKDVFYSVMFNPIESNFIATANNKYGIALWDIRKPNKCCLVRYGGKTPQQSAMSVRFNSVGTKILALRRRLPPVLYDIHESEAIHEFDSPGYYNSCTMKSCCFAGYNDEYVLSGSDDFKLYMWKIPSSTNCRYVKECNMVLKGHRSIVNQVRFNPSNFLLASSGVEKIVKIWSLYPTPNCQGLLTEEFNMINSRKFYSLEDYVNLTINSGVFMTHDYSHHSVQEDAQMMAFFDSLVQRDIEGWESDSTDSFSQDNLNWEETSITTESSANDTDDESSSSGCSPMNSKIETNDYGNSFSSHLKTFQPVNEKQMQISDLLSKRIATKRNEMKQKLSKLNKSRRKLKKNYKKKSKKVGDISSISLQNYENEASTSNANGTEFSQRNSTNDSDHKVLGHTSWFNAPLHHSDPQNSRCKLRRTYKRILMNLDDSDSISSDDNQTQNTSTFKESLPSQHSGELENQQSITNFSVNPITSGESSQTVNNLNASRLENNSIAISNDVADVIESISEPEPSTSNNITWAEFKKFKSKVKRASRQYRKQDNSDNDSNNS